MHQLSWPQAISWHLRRQHLDERVPRAQLLKVASELGGLHAQVMSSAEIMAWCRVRDLRRADISNHIWKTRRLIKAWAMRQTLHLLPAREYGMWLRAWHTLYPYRKSPSWLKYFAVTQEELDTVTEAIGEALRDRVLTREQLANEVARLTNLPGIQEKLRMSWGMLLKPASYRGYLSFGPNEAQFSQFMSTGVEMEAEDTGPSALHRIAERYLATYGPTTEQAFVRWLHVGAQNTGMLKAALREAGVPVDVEGTKAWMLRKHVRPALEAEQVRTVRLLPAFDQYVFAAAPHSRHVLPGDFRARIYRDQGWFSPVVLVDGRMDGIWRFDRKSNRLLVTVEPFVRFPAKTRRAVAEEAEGLADFMEQKLELKWL